MSIDTLFRKFPVLETERLILREPRLSDAEALFRSFSDEQTISQMGGVDAHKTVDESRQLIRQMHSWYARREAVRWIVILKAAGNDTSIGTAGYHEFDWSSYKAEMGYELEKPYRGHGYMTEAVLRIMDYGFHTMKLQRIEAATDDVNAPSWALLKRIGFTQEGCLRRRVYYHGKFRDEYWFGMLREEYLAKYGA